MPFTPGANDGSLNGTTPVTLVAAPESGVARTVRLLSIYNADTASVTVSVRYTNGANHRLLAKVTLGVGETFVYEEAVVLDSTSKSITAVMSDAAETWQALSAPTVKREFTKPNLEVALFSVKACAWGLEERDYVFALMDKLSSYLQSFDALDALSRLPREVVMKAVGGKLS